MPNTSEEPINEIGNKLSPKAKVVVVIVFLFILGLLLCIWGKIPNIPILQQYGINCGCHETSYIKSHPEVEKTKEELLQLQKDTINLNQRIAATEARISIAEKNMNTAMGDKNVLQDDLEDLKREKQNLENMLHQAGDSLIDKKAMLESLIIKNETDNKVKDDSVKFYRNERDSVKIANNILSHVHVTSIKAYTDRTKFTDKTKVNKINISYTLSGIDTLKKYLKDKSFTVSFKIKDSNGIYKELGEQNPNTHKSLHTSACDAISFSNTSGNSITKDVPFPNWQSPFSIYKLYTIETYIEFNGSTLLVSETIQNLKIRERVYSPIEIKRKN